MPIQIFGKTPGAGGNAVVKPKKDKMREKGAGGYAVFRKPQEKPEAMKIFTAKKGIGRKQEPEAMPLFGKPRTQPEAM